MSNKKTLLFFLILFLIILHLFFQKIKSSLIALFRIVGYSIYKFDEYFLICHSVNASIYGKVVLYKSIGPFLISILFKSDKNCFFDLKYFFL